MDSMLEGTTGAVAIMDDILIAAPDMKAQDEILHKVTERATSFNLKLNFRKCHVRQSQVPYVGHLLTADGLKPDPTKAEAVQCMAPPTDREGVRRFPGFVTYLSKFIPSLSEEDAPPRQLLESNVEFSWQPAQEKAFARLKDLCSHPPVLKYCDPTEPVEIFCDASSSGLGAVLLRDSRPVAFSSRSLTDAAMRYAQIEKETLSMVHTCIKFHHFIFGKQVTVYNDHKPLKDICRKLNHIAVSDEKYSELQGCTKKEPALLQHTIQQGWPEHRRDVPAAIQPYWDSRSQLTVSDGIVYKSSPIYL